MKYFWLDYETFLIQPACQAPPPVCMIYAYDSEPQTLVHAADSRFANVLEAALRNPDVHVVAHNAAFEAIVTLAYRPDWVTLVFDKLRQGKWHCTMVREKLIRVSKGDKREGFGLDDCLEAHKLNIKLDKENYWRTRFGTLYEKPVSEWPAEAVEYVTSDIAVRDLSWAQQRSTAPEIFVDEAHQMRAAVTLSLTSARGVVTDSARAETLVAATEDQIKADEETLLREGLARVTKKGVVKNTKAAKYRIEKAYLLMGREAPRGDISEKMEEEGVTEGNISLDKDACELSRDDVMKAYSRYSRANTLLSKARRLLRTPIQCRYDVLKETGRTGCSQGDDPDPGEPWTAYGMQLQNLPKAEGVRECLVARPGHAIVSVDYDAFEMRTWAQVCQWVLGYSDLKDILNDPKRCPHVEMGARLKQISVADAYALKKLDPEAFKALRGLAKGPNFGLPGGMAWLRLKDYCYTNYGVDISDEPAQTACRVWREIYSEAQPYLDWVKGQVGRQFGSRSQIEQFVSKRLRGNVGYTEAANGYFQGLAADIAKDAGWHLVEEAYEKKSSPLYGCRPLVFVHDEWLYEVPLDRIHEAGYRMAEVMTSTAMEWCPDVTFTAAPAAMLRWSKKAGDPVHDSNGRLVVFEQKEA